MARITSNYLIVTRVCFGTFATIPMVTGFAITGKMIITEVSVTVGPRERTTFLVKVICPRTHSSTITVTVTSNSEKLYPSLMAIMWVAISLPVAILTR